jgi:hypothetical protein
VFEETNGSQEKDIIAEASVVSVLSNIHFPCDKVTLKGLSHQIFKTPIKNTPYPALLYELYINLMKGKKDIKIVRLSL